MKLYKALFFVLTIIVFTVSCKKETKIEDKMEVHEVTAQELKNVEVTISGMTCEIGCAKLIQSKLYKTEGVTFAEVSFEKEKGNITFDSSRLNDEELKAIIERIAGGDLYKVDQMTVVSDFSMEQDNIDL